MFLFVSYFICNNATCKRTNEKTYERLIHERKATICTAGDTSKELYWSVICLSCFWHQARSLLENWPRWLDKKGSVTGHSIKNHQPWKVCNFSHFWGIKNWKKATFSWWRWFCYLLRAFQKGTEKEICWSNQSCLVSWFVNDNQFFMSIVSRAV